MAGPGTIVLSRSKNAAMRGFMIEVDSTSDADGCQPGVVGVNQGSIDSVVHGHYIIAFGAEVVEWQTRTFEGRVGKPVRVQIPPSAPTPFTGTFIVIRYSLNGRPCSHDE